MSARRDVDEALFPAPREDGPPWILGARGSPLEAPENTRASLARALDVGLDGVAYELRATKDGEIVLHRDAKLDRTTDGHGRVAERTWRELVELDAGGWFGARFSGERVLLLQEALALEPADGRPAQHVLLLEEDVDLARVASIVAEHAPRTSVRVASRERELCVLARDLGLVPLYLGERLGRADRDFVARERIAACGASPSAWRSAGSAAWDCERWMIGADAPDDLLAAVRAPFFGVTTTEPVRALALRALRELAPDSSNDRAIEVPELTISPAPHAGGSWWGHWKEVARVRNPLPFAARATIGILPRRGAFDVRGVPRAVELAPGEEAEVPFELRGGAWRPGGDPQLFASFRWRAGPGRPAGRLLLDAPLARVRRLVADVLPVRVALLRESPSEREATMVVRRSGPDLLVSVENAGGAEAVHVVVRLGERTHRGSRGVRVRLPQGFDDLANGVAFSCGFEGRVDGAPVLRRWAGGLPDEIDGGAPGRIHAPSKAR